MRCAALPLITLSLPLALLTVGATSGMAQAETTDFWPMAEKIATDQATLLDEAERAVMSQDPIQNQRVSSLLIGQLRSMDRFVQRHHYNPRQLCQVALPTGKTPLPRRFAGAIVGLEPAQVEAYCAIYNLSLGVSPLRPLLTQRAALFNTSRSARSVGLFFTQPLRAPFDARSVEQVNLGTTIQPQAQAAPTSGPQLLGRQSMKQATDRPATLIAPAIAPREDIATIIAASREQLATIQANLPRQFAASTPVASFNAGRPPKTTLRETAVASQPYAAFLKRANTGISTVHAEQSSTPAANRLTADDVPLPFGLKIQAGQLVITGAVLDYGFMANVGDVDLAKARSVIPETFTTYQPPTDLGEVQVDQRRFWVGKDTEFSAQVPVVLDRTYVMRSIQYDLPELVASGRPLKPGERGQLKGILQATGRDRLIAFRPIAQNSDGSYSVLWQVLKTNPAPTLQGLDRYISINLKTRGQN
jgi:hypothetical protein